MLILIDESGDSGFKLDKGSSKFLVIAGVFFCDFSEAEKTASELKLLKKELNLLGKTEFHFSTTHPKIKEAFFCRVVQITSWFAQLFLVKLNYIVLPSKLTRNVFTTLV